MSVYLDFNATTPVDPRVRDAMEPFFTREFANPSSAHARGAVARAAVDRARTQVGELVRCDPSWVTLTSSATEAINTVIWSVAMHRGDRRRRIVATVVEHSAVLESSRALGKLGIDVTLVPVGTSGELDLDRFRTSLQDDVLLACVMWANNETGVVFPIEQIAEICAQRGIPLLVDAVQAIGKLRLNIDDLPITYIVGSAHKLFGPKGAAALFASPRAISPLIVGGGQEHGKRSGTENVPAIVGFGRAAELALLEVQQRADAARALRDSFEGHLRSMRDMCTINGDSERRLPNTTSVRFFGIDADALVGALDACGVAIASGSACHARTVAPSHVILAMTGSREHALETVRVSFSHLNTDADVDALLTALEQTRASLRVRQR